MLALFKLVNLFKFAPRRSALRLHPANERSSKGEGEAGNGPAAPSACARDCARDLQEYPGCHTISGAAHSLRAGIVTAAEGVMPETRRIKILSVKPTLQSAPAGSADATAFLSPRPGGVLLAVKLQPRASKNEIGEPLGEELKIKVTAPPVDAAANQALIELLAETLGCSRGKVELIRGQTSRHKTVMLHGFTAAEALKQL